MLVFTSLCTQFAGSQECLVGYRVQASFRYCPGNIWVLGGLDVEGCFLLVAHKLRRMRTNPFSGAGVLSHPLALRPPVEPHTPTLFPLVLRKTKTCPLTCPKLSLPCVTYNNKHITQKVSLSLPRPE